MPLSLDQYATFLDSRDLPWPVPPPPDPPKAKPHLKHLAGVRGVLWNVYGTLLVISEGELVFEHSNEFVMETALDKTIQEFKMWQSMSRKPGQPAEYMKELYQKALFEQSAIHGEVSSEKVWQSIIKKLLQKEYVIDAGFYGSLNEFSEKVAYFFHASLQGTGCYPEAAKTVKQIAQSGRIQGLLANAQVFTPVQLERGLKSQMEGVELESLMPKRNRFLSHTFGVRKPNEELFRIALKKVAEQGMEPREILHVGSDLNRDISPAKKLGMKTALFAGDRRSLRAEPDRLKDPALRPDVLVTELAQIVKVLE